MTRHQKLVWAAAIVAALLYIGAIIWYDYTTHDHSKKTALEEAPLQISGTGHHYLKHSKSDEPVEILTMICAEILFNGLRNAGSVPKRSCIAVDRKICSGFGRPDFQKRCIGPDPQMQIAA